MWDDERDSVRLIDQTLLPEKFDLIECGTVQSLIQAIKSMQIRGAPAIGVAGAMGVALSLVEGRRDGLGESAISTKIREDAKAIVEARPTAVNLSWGVNAALDYFRKLPPRLTPREERRELIRFVKELADNDVETNMRLAGFGQKLIRDGSSILTHCN